MPVLFRRSNGIYYQVTYFHGRRIWRLKLNSVSFRVAFALSSLNAPVDFVDNRSDIVSNRRSRKEKSSHTYWPLLLI